MWESFVVFNINAVSHFVYLLTSNAWFFLLIVSMIGSIILLLKGELDNAVRNEQDII